MLPGDIIPYIKMCSEEGCNLQRGMNFRLRGGYSIFLMSIRKGAPYADSVSEDGRILTYEGHDINNNKLGLDPKKTDQPEFTPNKKLTQNGLFHKAAQDGKKTSNFEKVKVYEKIKDGIWVYNGIFNLIDSAYIQKGSRKVFNFILELTDEVSTTGLNHELIHDRLIPTHVKLEVWTRDNAKCVTCGAVDNLHFDHIIPYSKGGSSKTASNIQLLCMRHNLGKRDRII